MNPWLPYGLKSSNESQINISKAQEYLDIAYELLNQTIDVNIKSYKENFLLIDIALSNIRLGRKEIATKIESQIDSLFIERYNNAYFLGLISVQDSLELLKKSNKMNAFRAEVLFSKLIFDGHYPEAINLANDYKIIDNLFYEFVRNVKDFDSALKYFSYFKTDSNIKHLDLIISYYSAKEIINFDQVEILLSEFQNINNNYYYDLCWIAFQERRFDLFDKYLGLSKFNYLLPSRLHNLFTIYDRLDNDERGILTKVINKYSFISNRSYYKWLIELYTHKKTYDLIIQECQKFKNKYQFSEIIINYFISENQIDNAISYYNISKHDQINPNHIILVKLIEIGDYERCNDFFNSLKTKAKKYEAIEKIIAKLCELNQYDLAFQWLEKLKIEGSKKTIYYPSINAWCQNKLSSISLSNHNYDVTKKIIDSFESDIDKVRYLIYSANFLMGCKWATAEYIVPNSIP